MCGCTYIGPEQDPLKDYPIQYCGKPVFPGRSYCPDHVWVVYQKHSSIGTRRKVKEIERELAHIRELEEIGNPEA